MSLVVAKILDGRIRIESDSQLNNPNIYNQNPVSTVLKVIIVTPRMAVCFAGTVVYAHAALCEVFSKVGETPDISPEELCSILLEKHLQYDEDIDFILCSSEIDNPKIYKISHRRISEEPHSVWVGDYDGFGRFQSFYNNIHHCDLDYDAKCDHFTDAFKQVIEARDIPSVAGFQISISSSRENALLKYLASGELFTAIQTIPGNTTTQMHFGDAAMGGYAVSHFSSRENDTPAIAIYFAQLRLGLVYIPSISLNVIRVEDLDGLDFITLLNTQYGIELNGLLIDLEKNTIRNIGSSKIAMRLNGQSDNDAVLHLVKVSGNQQA